MTTLSEKLATLAAALLETEGTSLGSEDTQLIYLRTLGTIDWVTYLEDIVLNLETLVSAAQFYLSSHTGSLEPDFTGVSTCETTLGSSSSKVGSDGRTYAQWVTLPPSTHLVSLDAIFGVKGLQSDLDTYWNGITIYVQSTADTFKLWPYSDEMFPTGRMITIRDATRQTIAPSIAGAGDLTVHICTFPFSHTTIDVPATFWPAASDPSGRDQWRMEWPARFSPTGANTQLPASAAAGWTIELIDVDGPDSRVRQYRNGTLVYVTIADGPVTVSGSGNWAMQAPDGTGTGELTSGQFTIRMVAP